MNLMHSVGIPGTTVLGDWWYHGGGGYAATAGSLSPVDMKRVVLCYCSPSNSE